MDWDPQYFPFFLFLSFCLSLSLFSSPLFFYIALLPLFDYTSLSLFALCLSLSLLVSSSSLLSTNIPLYCKSATKILSTFVGISRRPVHFSRMISSKKTNTCRQILRSREDFPCSLKSFKIRISPIRYFQIKN